MPSSWTMKNINVSFYRVELLRVLWSEILPSALSTVISPLGKVQYGNGTQILPGC